MTKPLRAAGDDVLDLPMAGSAADRHLIEMLDGLVGVNAAVLVGGQDGTRTALLDEVARTPGFRVIRIRDTAPAGPHRAVADLVAHAGNDLDRLPDAQRRALTATLPTGSAETGSAPAAPLAICMGALNLLTATAEDRPVVVLVDDYDRIDAPSRQVLSFVARRSASRRIVVLLGVGDGSSTGTTLALPAFCLSGLPLVELRGVASAVKWSLAAIVAAGEPIENRHDRSALLLAAAQDAQLLGASEPAVRWSEELLAQTADPAVAADAELVRGQARTALGRRPGAVAADLVRAAHAVARRDPVRAARLYAAAVVPLALANRYDEALATARQAESLEPAAHRSLPVAVAAATAFGLRGHVAAAEHRLALGERLATGSVHEVPWLTLLAWGRTWQGDVDGARRVAGTAVDIAKRTGALAALAPALVVRGRLDTGTGHWVSAHADLREAARIAEELDHVPTFGLAMIGLARLDAARGEFLPGRRRLDHAERKIEALGLTSLVVPLLAARAFLALTADDPVEAAALLDRVRELAGQGGLAGPVVATFAADLVEAHTGARHRTAAAGALAWLADSSRGADLPGTAAAEARCRGLLAENIEDLDRWFTEAGRQHDRCPMPFEQARTALCAAEATRRLRGAGAVRRHLREALSIFNALGAQPWTARAEAELAASRTRESGHREGQLFDQLSHREMQIARAVAIGSTNTEVAAQLYISTKTVESNLTRIYRKLALRSRTDLARTFPR